jgi:hypothetical protein
VTTLSNTARGPKVTQEELEILKLLKIAGKRGCTVRSLAGRTTAAPPRVSAPRRPHSVKMKTTKPGTKAAPANSPPSIPETAIANGNEKRQP